MTRRPTPATTVHDPVEAFDRRRDVDETASVVLGGRVMKQVEQRVYEADEARHQEVFHPLARRLLVDFV